MCNVQCINKQHPKQNADQDHREMKTDCSLITQQPVPFVTNNLIIAGIKINFSK